MTKVEDLRPGDLVDLQYDPFADPYGAVGYVEDWPDQDCDNRDMWAGWHDYEADHMYYSEELATVIEPPERDNGGVTVQFSYDTITFPLGHLVKKETQE